MPLTLSVMMRTEHPDVTTNRGECTSCRMQSAEARCASVLYF
jgi:hypothetical protein